MQKTLFGLLYHSCIWSLSGGLVLAQTRDEGIRPFKESDDLYIYAKSTQDMQLAVNKFKQALEIFEKEPHEKRIAGTANKLSMIYRRWGE